MNTNVPTKTSAGRARLRSKRRVRRHGDHAAALSKPKGKERNGRR